MWNNKLSFRYANKCSDMWKFEGKLDSRCLQGLWENWAITAVLAVRRPGVGNHHKGSLLKWGLGRKARPDAWLMEHCNTDSQGFVNGPWRMNIAPKRTILGGGKQHVEASGSWEKILSIHLMVKSSFWMLFLALGSSCLWSCNTATGKKEENWELCFPFFPSRAWLN